MIFQDIYDGLIMITITVFFSVGTVIGFGLMLDVRQQIRRELMPWAFVIVAVVTAVGTIVSGRNLTGISVLFSEETESGTFLVLALRIVNLIIFLISLDIIVRYVFSNTKEKISGWPLYAAFFCYQITNTVINGIWGKVPELSHLALYPIIATLAFTIIAPREVSRLIWFAKSALLIMLALSLLILIVSPSIVLQRGYTDSFITYRFWGLGSHANTMSSLMVCMLLCLWHQPYKRPIINRLVWSLGLVSLLFTQSKTSILAFIVSIAILLFYRYKNSIPSVRRSSTMRRLLIAVIGFSMLLVGSILVLQVVFGFDQIFQMIQSTRAGKQLATLSSRDLIWGYALKEWHANPWFGYGPLIFEADYRLMIGLRMAYHAHNQFLQSLSSAGNFGVVGLLIFVGTLSVYAWRAATATSGLTLAFLVFILIRSIAEVPLQLRGVGSSEYFFLITFYVICIAYQPQVVDRRRTHNTTAILANPSGDSK